jgi:DNA-binding response OmpR family regulator
VRILFVEDNAFIREFTVEALREEGFEVIQASDGEEALAWCQRRVADVLVTDSSCRDWSTGGKLPNAVASMIRNYR